VFEPSTIAAVAAAIIAAPATASQRPDDLVALVGAPFSDGAVVAAPSTQEQQHGYAGILQVTVHSAAGLKSKDRIGKSDPYVVLRVGDAPQQAATKVIHAYYVITCTIWRFRSTETIIYARLR
jgi:hypothetical protein